MHVSMGFHITRSLDTEVRVNDVMKINEPSCPEHSCFIVRAAGRNRACVTTGILPTVVLLKRGYAYP